VRGKKLAGRNLVITTVKACPAPFVLLAYCANNRWLRSTCPPTHQGRQSLRVSRHKHHQATAPARPISQRPTYKEVLQAAATKPSLPFEGEGWTALFDGKTLKGWKPTEFAGHGNVECELGCSFSNRRPIHGCELDGQRAANEYEIALDTMRVNGSDFFCGLTIPVKDSCCSLIVGGWAARWLEFQASMAWTHPKMRLPSS